MAGTEQKLSIYNYHVASFDIIIPGQDTVSLDQGMVVSFNKVDDFDNNVFPLFSVKLLLRKKDYYNIIKYNSTVKFRIRLQKSKMDNTEVDSKKAMKEDVFNDIFCCYLSDSTPQYDEKLQQKANEVVGASNNKTPEDLSNYLELYLFKEQDITGTKNVINVCLGSLDLTDMIFLLYSKAGLSSNFLMEILDNKQSFSEIIMPPIPFLGAMKYLETYYGGFYKVPTLMYFDFNTRYLIKRAVACGAWKSGEFKQTVLLVRAANDPQKNQVSCERRADEKKYYISINPELVTINKESIYDDAIDGTNLVVVGSKSGSVSNLTTNVTKRGSGAQKVLYNDLENTRLSSVAKSEIESNGASIMITVTNVDIAAFTPNKEFIIKFLDTTAGQGLSGSYRLSKASYEFNHNGEQGFNISATLTFKK